MSLKLFDIPSSSYEAEIEYLQFIVRMKLDGQVQQVYHISGCEIGRCCVKDAHSKSSTFNIADHRAVDYILSLHNFKLATHDRQLPDGNFNPKTVSIRGLNVN